MDFRLPTAFRFGLNWAISLSESVEAILVGSLDTIGTGGYIQLLLRGATRVGDCGTSALSTPEDTSKPLKDLFLEIRGRR